MDVGSLDEDALVGLRRRIGMIFQHFNLLSAKTVAQNVALPLRVAGAVSYTHLDVYKRQALHWAPTRRHAPAKKTIGRSRMRAPAMPRVSPRFTTPALALTLALSLMLAGGASAGPAAAPAANAPAPAARSSTAPAAAPAKADRATAAVDAAVADVMRQYGIAGMAIGVSRDGEQRFFNYGDASREPRRAVSSDTLFELCLLYTSRCV